MIKKILLLITCLAVGLNLSAQESRSLNDDEKPRTPIFDTLSVDNNNNATMSWFANPETNVAGYVVYLYNKLDRSWPIIDTVWGRTNTSYTYLKSVADSASEKYALAAFNTNKKISPLTANDSAFFTIYLTVPKKNCDSSVTLSWTTNKVINGAGVAGYRIYSSVTGMAGTYVLDGIVDANTYTYQYRIPFFNTSYHFKVEAFNQSNTKTSSSNRVSFYSRSFTAPQFIRLRKASVEQKNVVTLTCEVDVNASTAKYIIKRSLDTIASNFIEVGTQKRINVNTFVYNDNTVFTDKNSYYYKIICVDSCDKEVMESQVVGTVLLNGKANSSDMTNTLSWDDCEYREGSIIEYRIYRGIDGNISPIAIDTVNFDALGNNIYIDSIANILDGKGLFSYYIETLFKCDDCLIKSDSSKSNMIEVYHEPRIFIPSAFNPSSTDVRVRTFSPTSNFVDYQEYELYIYNRSGCKVFSTTDIEQRWDGGNNEMGMYIYWVRYKNSRGKYVDYKGTVTLIR